MRPVKVFTKRGKLEAARQISQQVQIPAPILGLNTRDSLSVMQPTEAVVLENAIPQPSGLVSRNGYAEFATGLSSNVETLIPYTFGATENLIAASGSVLYKVATDGTVTSIATGLANARWQSAQLGQNVLLVNGSDAPRNYDGSTITTPSFTGGLSSYGPQKMDGVAKHKSRLYFWDAEYPSFWYGGVNAISGNFDEFQLGRVSDTGGNVIFIGNISRDVTTATGSDDYAAFILNTGEILIYQGSDPSSATDWALVGKYKAPPLIGARCATSYGGDILLLTKNDIIKLSDVIKYSSTDNSGAFNIQPSKLSGAVQNDYNNYSSNYGFSVIKYPKEGWIIINIPETTNSTYHQWVINTQTNGACKFTGWNANCFAVLGDNLYFGGSTKIYLANSGLDDNGADINISIRQAWTDFGTPQKKQVSIAKVLYSADGSISMEGFTSYDYTTAASQGATSSSTEGAEWDLAEWDLAEWAGAASQELNFFLSGIGVVFSFGVDLSIRGQKFNWYSSIFNLKASKSAF